MTFNWCETTLIICSDLFFVVRKDCTLARNMTSFRQSENIIVF